MNDKDIINGENYRRLHLYGNIDPFKIPKTADKLLNEYWNIAEDLGIKTFLLYGTCLGLVRDGGYIEGDNDIDVGILEGKDKLIAELIKNGFICKTRGDVNVHFLKYSILLDIFFAYPNEAWFKVFDEVTYKGRVYNVPHPIEEFLIMAYGNWKGKSSKAALRR